MFDFCHGISGQLLILGEPLKLQMWNILKDFFEVEFFFPLFAQERYVL